MRAVVVLLGLALAAFAANFRLYLKDGSYHVVREYKVLEDRVRYYSVERGDWEEIPADLVDLKRTETEFKQRRDTLAQEAKLLAEEEKVDRERAREIARVPQEPGVYLVAAGELIPLKQAESKVHGNKGRSVLKVLTPIPIVSGKATVEIDGARSLSKVTLDRPEFYIRLSVDESFGIVRLKPEKNTRVVEKVTIVPVTREIIEEPELVEVFRQQVDEGLYKIWPTKPLAPGEYAVVEYTEGKLNIQVWDFAYDPKAKQ